MWILFFLGALLGVMVAKNWAPGTARQLQALSTAHHVSRYTAPLSGL